MALSRVAQCSEPRVQGFQHMGMPQPSGSLKGAPVRPRRSERAPWRSRPLIRARAFGLVLLVGGSLTLLSPARGESADQRSYSDREVKATYFFRLSNFFEWPASDWPAEGKPLYACLIGRDPFRSALDFFDGKSVRGRRFTLRRLSTIQESRGCHLLYVGADDRSQIRSILFHIRDRSVLSVGDGVEFAHLGGSVAFVLENQRVRLALNPDAARRCGLTVSSKLLEMVSIVGEHSQ
jgi:hypothetical protein